MKILPTSLTALLLCSSLYSQNTPTASEATQSRIQGTQRAQPAPITGQNTGGQQSSASGLSESDTGAQRPISLNDGGISAFFGFDTKFFYRENPLSQTDESKLSIFETAMWTNTFFGGAGLGVFDFDDAIVTPYVGGSYTINDYLEDNLDVLQLNYNSTSVYALLLAQHSSGWSGRIGVTYAMDRSTEFDTEDYSEYFPNIGVMKTYSLGPNTIGILDAYAGLHLSTIEAVDAPGTTSDIPEDNLDTVEFAASYGLKHDFGKITFLPKYLISHKSYSNGQNSSRDDLTHTLSLKADYPILDSFILSGFAGYTVRDSSGTTSNYDYNNLDGGFGFTLTSRF